ncbi:discoidin domain-containing protein [Spirilliplanes yamanashiensis]|uniref:F5/8 type C domain-containing protein n=1 Tax=Spirilliplanes yamanashiensis TaxID=42233 RepID=A0A8J3Y9N4_9ACTN|nr:discoidin domain-containing protein [Spirilliplanes yamanashiensis]MDP9817648.1 hypothetical protein [Spirilliplanes yamanashiensis]GIJ04458.1 hypothetical protein Sya03_38100 [Spirilliplanes yamanashiensis]
MPAHRQEHRRRWASVLVAVVAAGLLAGGLNTAWGAEGNLAAGRAATGSAPCTAAETPRTAVTASVRDKFCSAAERPFLQVDLGAPALVGRIVVQHAQAGGEPAAWNTRDFTLSVSADGAAFTAVAAVTGSTAATTAHTVTPVRARYVRLDVTRPTGTGDRAARIAELEVYPAAAPTPSIVPPVSAAPCHGDAPPLLTDFLQGHGHPLTRAACNADVAVYHDAALAAVPAGQTAWATAFTTDVWRYMKDAYGSCAVPRPACERFGEPRPLLALFHRTAGAGAGGTIRYRFDAATGNRATIDVAAGSWADSAMLRDVITHEACHHAEFDGQGVLDSPAFTVWGDSKWAEFCVYDFYVNTGRQADAERVRADFGAGRDALPPGAGPSAWFRDWFLPLWRDGGGRPDVMRRFFELTAEHFPRREYGGGAYAAYTRRMTAGEYVHFTSAAAGQDLSGRAAAAFGTGFDRAQFERARRDFPALTY